MKAAVLFPGIGYTCEKPLLYYAAKVALAAGYEVIRVPYGGFPAGVKGDERKMRDCFLSAVAQSEALLRDVDWTSFGEIVFIGKSIGTAAASCYAGRHELPVRSVLLTPVAETFGYTAGEAVAYHGTADPWAKTEEIRKRCEEQRIRLIEVPGANHSLETGDPERNLETLAAVMRSVRQFLDPARAQGGNG